MYCSTSSFLLYTLAAAAIIVRADKPPIPGISETFSSWFINQVIYMQNGTLQFVGEEEGYIARDMQGGRQVSNGTYKLIGENKMYYYSQLDLERKGASYHTLWDNTNGTKTCQMSSDATIFPFWDWVKFAKYTGRAGNMDIWTWDLLNSLTQEIRVSVDDSTVPLVVTGDDKSSHSHVKKAYIGFNSNYQPNDSDFEIPPECQSVGKDHTAPPPHFIRLFNHHKQRI